MPKKVTAKNVKTDRAYQAKRLIIFTITMTFVILAICCMILFLFFMGSITFNTSFPG